MAAKIFYQQDCNLSLLDGKTIAIIGYGSQGHAHALNLKDSGCNVIIGLYEGSKSWSKAEAQGFKVYTAAEAAKQADIIMILINDEKQADLYKNEIEPNLEAGNMLMFAHGFNIHFGTIVPPKNVDVTMIAPKGPGHTVRSEYQAGKGVPCLIAVEQDATGKAQDIALAYALGIGGARAGVLETTFRTEKVCLCLCTECSLEDTGSCSSDRKTICESFIKSFSCIILLYSYKARSSFSNLILASYSMSRSFRSDHCHIYVRRRNDLSEMNVKAVCKHQHITFFKIRLNIVFI